MKKISKTIMMAAMFVFGITAQASSQYLKVSPDKYAVKFTDKDNNGYTLDHPEKFLTQKALDRRAKYQIDLDYYDLPVNKAYVDSLKSLGFRVHGTSKWLNCAVIQTQNPDELQKLQTLSFIAQDYQWLTAKCEPKEPQPPIRRPRLREPMIVLYGAVYDYGKGWGQMEMLNICRTHVTFGGQKMTVAVLDDGFYKADQLKCFAPLQKEGRVLGVHDFVDNDSTVYDCGVHGMQVLSCLAGKWDYQLVGTAPEASVYLFRTEDDATENILEEFLWAFAAETADSLGVDMIFSGVGHHIFDDTSASYRREQCDGNTAISDIAADRAASKGIVVIASAGDNGDNAQYPWVSSPANADSVLAVGAVNKDTHLAFTSSIGPTADGRIKPDVCAMGVRTAVQDTTGQITYATGTSYAAATLAGCVLCLMQQHPKATAMEILMAVRVSGDRHNNPDNEFGYGIPDFELADRILDLIDVIRYYKNKQN